MFAAQDHNLLAMMRKLAPDHFNISEPVLRNSLPFKLPEQTVSQICAALNSGKHIIFVGAPGTGKTTVAQALCRAAYSLFLSFGKGLFTTATADWTTFDTVGGYMPDVRGSGRLVFTPGIITRSILDRQWLVLDEINRADIDKAIGPFFSVLSNQEVVLPFKNSSGVHYTIRLGAVDSTETEFYVHPHWRMVGTMNDFDKMSLYKLSYAFLRRFAVIRINTPDLAEMIRIVTTEVPECDLNNGLANLVKITHYRELGPGVYLDMARYIVSRCPVTDRQTGEHTKEAVELYLLPQFQGLPKAINEKIAGIIREALPDFDFDEEKMEFRTELT